MHLVVEATCARALSSGVRGLSIRRAKRLNEDRGNKGLVFVERYGGRALKTPQEVGNCLCRNDG